MYLAVCFKLLSPTSILIQGEHILHETVHHHLTHLQHHLHCPLVLTLQHLRRQGQNSDTILPPPQLMYSQNQPVQWAVQTTHILCMIQPTYMKQCNFVRARSTARTTCQTQEFDVMCLAFFPGATQLSVACSMEKQNRAWHVFACKYCQFYKKISLSNHAHYLAIEKRLSYSLILAKTHPAQWVTLHNI